MNERIRELAEQTGYIWHASGDPQVYEFTPEKLDEFAELIVKECAIVGMVMTDDHFDVEALYKHFGIEP